MSIFSGIFTGSRYNGGFWFRLAGRGISVVDKEKHPPLFSERNGHRRVWRFGKWGVEWLRKKQ